MAWFLDYEVTDSAGFSGTMRVPVTEGTVPAGYVTYADAVGAAIFGDALISNGALGRINLVIADIGTPIVSTVSSEIRNKWQASMQVSGVSASRFSIPARNPNPVLLVPGSKIGANLAATEFTDALAALLGSGAIHMVEPDENVQITGWGPVVSATRSRKRPRFGGQR